MIPKKACVEKLIWSLDGSPWCKVSSSTSVNADTLQYSLDGSPTWSVAAALDPTTLQFSLDGSPWCRFPPKDTIDCDPLQYSLDGSPWWAQSICPGGSSVPVAYKFYKGTIGIPKMYKGGTLIPAWAFGNTVM